MQKLKPVMDVSLLLSILVLTLSCGPKHKLGTPSNDTQIQEEKISQLLEKPENILYSHVHRLVLSQQCIECHSKSGEKKSNVDLSSYGALFGGASKEVIKPYRPEESLLFETLIVPAGNRHMPPMDKSQLNEDQKNLVFQWILNGAKEKTSQKVTRPESLAEELEPYFIDPKIIDYKIVDKYIFKTSCKNCHSFNGEKSDFEGAIRNGQNMTTYKDMLSNFGIVKNQLTDYVVVNDETLELETRRGSRIYNSIAVRQTMPRIKDGYLPIDSLRVKLLRLWILNCAIEDYSTIVEDPLGADPEDPEKDRICLEPDRN